MLRNDVTKQSIFSTLKQLFYVFPYRKKIVENVWISALLLLIYEAIKLSHATDPSQLNNEDFKCITTEQFFLIIFKASKDCFQNTKKRLRLKVITKTWKLKLSHVFCLVSWSVVLQVCFFSGSHFDSQQDYALRSQVVIVNKWCIREKASIIEFFIFFLIFSE